jgi:mercuric ion transport protein
MGGAWMGSLAVAESYRPIFIALLLLLLGLGFHNLYLIPWLFARDSGSDDAGTHRLKRFAFWIAAAIFLGLLSVSQFSV